MKKMIIEGGHELNGTVVISGAKNGIIVKKNLLKLKYYIKL